MQEYITERGWSVIQAIECPRNKSFIIGNFNFSNI